MKKILILASWYPANDTDATGRFIATQAESLATTADVRVVDCTQKFSILPQSWRLPVQARRILKLCKETAWKPDLIHAHIAYPAGIVGLELKKNWGVPVVLTEHTGPLELLLPYFKSNDDFYRHYSRYDRVLAVSSFLRQRLLSGGPQFSVDVVGNIVRPEFFETILQIPANQASAVVVGGVTKEKGFLYLWDALQAYEQRPKAPELSLAILGRGPLREQWEKAAPSLRKTKVIFREPETSAAVITAINSASFLLLPSEVETFSLVAAEALALGRPVLGRQCGGPADFVSQQRGILLEGDNPAAFAEKMEEFAVASQWRGGQQALQARRDFMQQKFSSTAIAQQLCKIYSDLSLRRQTS